MSPAMGIVGGFISTSAQASQMALILENFQLYFVAIGGLALVFAYILVLRKLRRRAKQREVVELESKQTFSSVELERYSRHIMLREIGGEGQKKLKQTQVAVVGAGGLGSPAILYLAAAGFGTITVIDDDKIELSNLQRQIIHSANSIGESKAESAAFAVRRLNPHSQVRVFNERLVVDNLHILDGHDIVLDGSDGFETRKIVNRACVERKIPLVSGAISQWEGQVTVADPANGYPCMECLFPDQPVPNSTPTCAEAGVMGALPGIIGSLMATEAIKVVTGAGQPMYGVMLIYDALWAQSRIVKYHQRKECPVCGEMKPMNN